MMGSVGLVLLVAPEVLSQPILTILLTLARVTLALMIRCVSRGANTSTL